MRGWPGIEVFPLGRSAEPAEILTSVVALMQAKAFARAMSDKDDARWATDCRSIPRRFGILNRKQSLAQAKALASAERDKG